MSEIQSVARFALGFSVSVFGVVIGLMAYETISTFRERLKDRVSRRRAIVLFPDYTRHHWDFSQLARMLPLVLVVGFLLGAILVTFGIGLMEVVGFR